MLQATHWTVSAVAVNEEVRRPFDHAEKAAQQRQPGHLRSLFQRNGFFSSTHETPPANQYLAWALSSGSEHALITLDQGSEVLEFLVQAKR